MVWYGIVSCRVVVRREQTGEDSDDRTGLDS